MDYIADTELIELSEENRKQLDEIFKRAENKIIEKVLCTIPDMVMHLARRQQKMQELYLELFKKLPTEAQNDKETVASVVQKLEFANPQMSPEEIFNLVPDEYIRVKSGLDKIGGTKIDFSKLSETVNGVL